MEHLTGNTIRGYQLLQLIGEGGFGAVYRAKQSAVDRDVAIKIILPQYASSPEFIRRFEAEAQLVARLEHLHIVPLYDYWRDPEGAYLVMRWLRGGTLHDSLKEGALSPRGASRMLNQIAAALTVAHRAGIVHRDIKPTNILLDDDRNGYLSDFGIALNKREEVNAEGNKGAERIAGSAGYISPEVINLQEATPQSDIYSVGVMLWEMLMGAHPFAGATSAMALFVKHASEPLPPMENFPESVQKVIAKATSKKPEERYGDMLEFAAAFRAAIADMDMTRFAGTANLLEEFDTTNFELTPAPAVQADVSNPYKGLRAFQESDANDFFGRETLIEQLAKRMMDDHPLSRFLAVIGPSGSGKSSVVKAGLLPALRKDKLPDSSKWYIVEMMPGADPLTELEEAVLRVAARQVGNVVQRLKSSPTALHEMLNEGLPSEASQVLLVIDQFEEAFTLVDDLQRDIFLNNIQHAVTTENSRLRVIVTMRADFYDRPLMVQNFSTLMQQRTEVVIPLTVDELERAITTPARQVKVFFQQGLAATIVGEVTDQPGVLPMLQYALTELFERREGGLITTKAYQELGGVLGALARRAEEIYTQLTPPHQAAARQLMLRLVTLGEGTEDTRRRALQSEMLSTTNDPHTMQNVIDTFGSYRLLTFDRDPISRTPTVEVAHEALIRQWRRLRDWLAESREDIRLQRLLSTAATEWYESNQDPSFLLRGGRLVQFEEWSKDTSVFLTEREKHYLAVSIEDRERVEREEEEQRQKQILLEKRARQRLALLVAVMGVAFVISVIAAIFAFNAYNEAQSARNQAQINAQAAETNAAQAAENAQTAVVALEAAEVNAAEAQTQQANFQAAAGTAQANADEAATARADALVALGVSRSLSLAASAEELARSNAPLALALAIAANDVADPQERAQRVLASVVYQAPRRQFPLADFGIVRLLTTPDSQFLILGGDDGSVEVWDIANAQPVLELGQHASPITALAIRPDGTQAASASEDGTIIVWNLGTGERAQTLSGHSGSVTALSFNPVRDQLASSGEDAVVLIWNLATGQQAEDPITSVSTNAITTIDYSPDGENLMVIFEDALRMWNFDAQQYVNFGDPLNRARAGAFAPDGFTILTSGSGASGTPDLWDIRSGRRVRQLVPHNASVNSVDISPDGQLVVSGADDFTVILATTASEEVRRFAAHTAAVSSVSFSADGKRIYSADGDGQIYEWDAAPPEAQSFEVALTSIGNAMYTPDGGAIVTNADDGTINVYDAETGEVLISRALERPLVPQTRAVLSPRSTADNLLLLWGATDLRLLNLSTGEELQRFTIDRERAWVHNLAVNADGSQALWGGGYYFRDQLQEFTRASILTLWDLDTGELIREFAGHNPELTEGYNAAVTAVAFMPDGEHIISGGEDGTLYMWSLETGERVQEFVGHSGEITEILFQPETDRMLTASADRSIILWNTRTGAIVQRYLGHTAPVRALAFNDAGDNLLSGGEDAQILLWDINGQLIQRLGAGNVIITSVTFSPDEQFALAGGIDGRVTLWNIETVEGLIAFAQDNRYYPELDCELREQYNVFPLCDDQTTPTPEAQAASLPTPSPTAAP